MIHWSWVGDAPSARCSVGSATLSELTAITMITKQPHIVARIALRRWYTSGGMPYVSSLEDSGGLVVVMVTSVSATEVFYTSPVVYATLL
jgi:hypothetical protein